MPSPSRCIWCQLDKFSFFFFSLHLEPLQDNVNCNIAIATTSPLAHTGHTPSLPPPTPVTATSTPRYLTNPVAATTTTMPPLAPTLTCVTGHTQATPPLSLSLCIFFSSFYFILFYFILFYFILFYFILFYFSSFSFHLELVQDCNTTTGVIVQRAFVILVPCRVKPYQGFSSVMHKYQVKLRSRLM